MKYSFNSTAEQLRKFHSINSLSEPNWEQQCINCNDCSVCDFAIHEFFGATMTHICVYGMSKEKFEDYIKNGECNF